MKWGLHFTLMKDPSPKCQLLVYIIPAVHNCLRRIPFYLIVECPLRLITFYCPFNLLSPFTVSNRIFKSIGGVSPTGTNSRCNNKCH